MNVMTDQTRKAMKINDEFIKQFNPCEDSFAIYLKHYKGKNFTLKQFMNLKHLSASDKIWMFTRSIRELKKLQREFALICAARAVDRVNDEKLNELFTLQCLIVESSQYDLKSCDEWDSASTSAWDSACASALSWSSALASAWASVWDSAYASALSSDSA